MMWIGSGRKPRPWNPRASEAETPRRAMKASALAQQPEAGAAGVAQGSFKPVLSLWALVLFGLAFVGPTAPYTFFGVAAIGQLIEKPELPNLAPPGPVTRPSRTNVRIWNSSRT